jgi:hypothetical protein
MDARELTLCAEVGYEVLRRYKQAVGVAPGPIWAVAGTECQARMVEAAKYALSHTAAQLHGWMLKKRLQHKDEERECSLFGQLAPWNKLVLGDRVRYGLFKDVVTRLSEALSEAGWSPEEAARRIISDVAPRGQEKVEPWFEMVG